MEILLREAKTSDTKLLRDIEIADGYPYPYRKTPEDYLQYMKEGDTFFIAEVEGNAVGYISINDCTYLRSCRLHLLSIRSEYQSKGVGSFLMNTLEEEARRRQFNRIIVNVYANNPRAEEFYKRKGYSLWFIIPERYEGGIDAHVLSKEV